MPIKSIDEAFADQVAERLIGTNLGPWYAARDLGQWLTSLELAELVQMLRSRVKPCEGCQTFYQMTEQPKRPNWIARDDEFGDTCDTCEARALEEIEDEIEGLERLRSDLEFSQVKRNR